MYMKTLVEQQERTEQAAWRRYPDHQGLERLVKRVLSIYEDATVRNVAHIMKIPMPDQQLKFRIATLIYRNRPK